MPLPDAYAAYNRNKVLTASPAELTLMLYEGAIKFCNIENKDIEKAHTNIIKTEKIIEEFLRSLDEKYPVYKEFENVYVYLMRRLREANAYKDKEILEEVLTHLRSMRDTWKDVMNQSRPHGS